MIEANCPNCNRKTNFNETGKNKYLCSSCKAELHKCKDKQCNNMIGFGLYCIKCVGNGLKKGGSIVITTVCVVVVGGYMFLKEKK